MGSGTAPGTPHLAPLGGRSILGCHGDHELI
jgi:hypothetical protein